MLRKVLLVMVAFGLCGCVTNAAVKQDSVGVQAPQAATKSGMFGFSQEVAPIEVSGSTSKLQGVTDIIVPFYRITYLQESDYKNNVSSGMSATANVNATLEGVDSSIYASVTDAAHQDLMQKLKTAGYSVQGHSALPTIQSYTKQSSYPQKSEGAMSYVASGTTFVETSAFSTPLLKVEMAEKVNVMAVDLLANFVINNRNTKKFSLTEAKETVYTSQGANIAGNMSLRVPGTTVALNIKQPVHSKKTFGTLVDSTTGGDKAGDAAKMVASAIFGGGLARHSTSSKVVKADTAAYKAALLDALYKTNTKLVNELKNYK